jgi:hypothetical protein
MAAIEQDSVHSELGTGEGAVSRVDFNVHDFRGDSEPQRHDAGAKSS